MSTQIKSQDIASLEAPLLLADGTVALPGLAFASDTNTGLFLPTTDALNLVTGGITRISLTTTAISVALPLAMNNLQITGLGNISFDAPGTKGIIGCDGTIDATTGNVGEYIESVVANVNQASSGTFGDLASISLTAGDWDITALIYPHGGSNYTVWQIGISTTSGNSTAGLVLGSNRMVIDATIGTSIEQCLAIPNYHLKLTTTTTVYLKSSVTWTTGTAQGDGRLSARRIR